VYQGHFEQTDRELHRTYGPIVRIAPNEYSVDDPEAIKTIYGHASKFVKAPWYYASGSPDPHLADVFTERDPQLHAAKRRKIANLYSTTTLLRMEDSVNDCVRLMIDRFNELSDKRATFNMQHWMQCYAFDVIGQITVSLPYVIVVAHPVLTKSRSQSVLASSTRVKMSKGCFRACTPTSGTVQTSE